MTVKLRRWQWRRPLLTATRANSNRCSCAWHLNWDPGRRLVVVRGGGDSPRAFGAEAFAHHSHQRVQLVWRLQAAVDCSMRDPLKLRVCLSGNDDDRNG